MKSLLLGILFLSLPATAMTHGLSFDLGHGLGYTAYFDRIWAGISLSGDHKRFGDNQIVAHARAYGNYDFARSESVNLFGGASYHDDFGLREDSKTDKHRLFALTFGVSAKILENFRIASWVNVWGVRDDLIYDATTGRRRFDNAENRRSYLDFGGLMATYTF